MINMEGDVMGGQTARIGDLKRVFETISVIWEGNIKKQT